MLSSRGRRGPVVLTCALAAVLISLLPGRGTNAIAPLPAQGPDWPPVTRETRPWTRWWWMGSAVDRQGLTAELESLRAAGIGGVEITPIYGVAGTEAQFVPYLSDAWVGLLEHTLTEAARVDVGVDMATGTGWPFGGPWVGERDACRTLVHRTWQVAGGQRLTEPVRMTQTPLLRAVGSQLYEVQEIGRGEPPPQGTREQPVVRPGARIPQIGDLVQPVEANRNLQALALDQVRFPNAIPLMALVGYSDAGTVLDLTKQVGADGTLDWTAPPGAWTLYGVFLGSHGKMVERAAPGGEGNVIDHFSRDPIQRYLARFDQAFAGRRLAGLRAFFNDSYEVDDASGQATATPALFEEFQRRRGYDLRPHLRLLLEPAPGPKSEAPPPPPDNDTAARVLADYRETISDLLLETFTTEWQGWASRRSSIVRNQAHGSPASLLDLYAASDIPETEGTEIRRFKWATSAAHVAGRRLVSAEAATWLGEHFQSTLADVRAALDTFFIAGVNHIVYHGTAYSPPGDPWPGWQFYASVEFNWRNSWWKDFRALNEYVTRVQSFLQAGRPDHDVLLYYPVYDSFAARGPGLLKHFGGANPPAEGTPFERAATTLQQRGFTHDFVSDRQIAAAKSSGGSIVTGGGTYKTIVVPASRYMPPATFDHLLGLARAGAPVIFLDGLPSDVTGLADLANRRAKFNAMIDKVAFGAAAADGVREARLDRGRVLTGSDLERLLARVNVQREALVDSGLAFARRQHNGGRSFFIVNKGDRDVSGWIPLNDAGRAASVFDPMTGRRGAAKSRRSPSGALDVELTLPRGSSLIVATANAPATDSYPTYVAGGPPIPVPGPWAVQFAAGGPELPEDRTIASLASWTTFGGEAVQRFSGTAIYSTTLPALPAGAAAFEIDLGAVRDSARVLIDGREAATLLGPSFRLVLDRSQLKGESALAVHVTNLMANRIAAMDKAGVRWRKFYNVNFPSRLPQNRGPDGLFTAVKWEPLDSGLLGPVTVTPMQVR